MYVYFFRVLVIVANEVSGFIIGEAPDTWFGEGLNHNAKKILQKKTISSMCILSYTFVPVYNNSRL